MRKTVVIPIAAAGVFVLALGVAGAAASPKTKTVAGPVTTVTATATVSATETVTETETATETETETVNADPATVTRTVDPAIPAAPKRSAGADAVTYRVTGNGASSLVTYSVGSSIEQDTSARVPWSKTVGSGESFYSVSAQDHDGTSITCEIVGPGGDVLDRQTSRGPYAIASCTSS